MGSSNSTPTRNMTIDNDSPVGVIDVSDAVVQRLKSGLPKATASKPETRPSREHIPSSYPAALPPPPGQIFYAEPSVTSMDVMRQKENELKQNDQYWAKRLAEVEKNYQQTNKVLEAEYNQTVESVKKQFELAAPSHKQPKCVDIKEKVIKCLELNPKTPLNCSSVVDEFTKCVYDTKR